MSYFPASIRLDNKKVLLIGGGEVAYRKLLYLLEFTKNIDLIAKEFSPKILKKIKELNLNFYIKDYENGEIKDYSIVVVAIDNISLQKEIFEESKSYKCLCNCVDSLEYCDFVFPAYAKKDDLVITVSTSGSSPAFAKHFKNFLYDIIPDNIGEFLLSMKDMRKNLPKGKDRMELLNKKAKEYIGEFKL